MMEPPPVLRISGTAYFMPRNVPLRLTPMMRSQTSSGSLSGSPEACSLMPALLNRTSSLP